MVEITLKDIEKSFGVEQVLEGVSFEIKKGDRIGLIGKNGTGKTTIFKMIAGKESYESGILIASKGLSIGYLDQIPNYDGAYKVIDILNLAFESIFTLKNDMEALEKRMCTCNEDANKELLQKYGRIQLRYESLGGYSHQEKLNKVCSGLKITNDFKNKLFSKLSGGEKTKVILAKILIENPDVLLLDEPTNHLDIESVEWLEKFIDEYRGSVLIISHDRYFLDRVVTKIFEIHNKRINVYHGNYSYYVLEKKLKQDEMLQKYNSQQKKIDQMEDAIKRFKDWGKRADNPSMFKKASSMQKRIEKMEKIDKPIIDSKKINLKFSNTGRTANKIIVVKGLYKSFDNNNILENIHFEVNFGQAVGIIGMNGSGKTTLLKCILGILPPDRGEILLGSRAKIGYLEQVINFVNDDNTILGEFSYSHPMEECKARSALAKFLFYGDDVFKNIKVLSGGEKVRLKLCILMYQNINLLILDEPTNHLDIESREMFEKALTLFEGTIIFISHDRYFLNKFSNRIIQLQNSKVIDFYGDYDYFKEKIQTFNVQKTKTENIKKFEPNIEQSVNNSKSKNMINRIENLEKEIEIVDQQILDIEKIIVDVSCDYELLKEVVERKNHLIVKRDLMIEEWVTINS